jgi:hypothetical protein
MFRRKAWSTVCACGEPLEAMSRQGLEGLLRTHVLFDHGAVPDRLDTLDRDQLEVLGS